jgi:hypothetical protein
MEVFPNWIFLSLAITGLMFQGAAEGAFAACLSRIDGTNGPRLKEQKRPQIIMEALTVKELRFGFISLFLMSIGRIGILPAIIPPQKIVQSHVEHPDH